MNAKYRQIGICLLLIAVLFLPLLADGDAVDIEAKQFNGQPYLPLRATFEKLAYEVSWDQYSRVIVVDNGTRRLHFKPDLDYYLHDGVLLNSAEAPLIDRARTYLPVQTMRQIFSQLQSLGNGRYRVGRQLVAVDQGAKKLKDAAELKVLLSFYPQELYMEKGIVFERDTDVLQQVEGNLEDGAVELQKDFSDTNNQVTGVAESDIVKTDGDYIYALKGDSVQIFKADRRDLKIVAQLQSVDIVPHQMFLHGDKLVLIGDGYSDDFVTFDSEEVFKISRAYREAMTFIDVYDLSALSSGQVARLKRISVDGSYLSGRAIDQYLYIVANQYNYDIMPFDDLLRVDGAPLEVAPARAVDELMYFPGHVSRNMIYTIGIDLDQLSNNAFDVNAYLGGAQHIYADREHLYIADLRRDWHNYDAVESTDIYKFSIGAGKFNYQTSCNLPGILLNQFSMDAYKGYFRVALTTHRADDWSKTLNHLLILDGDLKVVGKVADLAPDERIYSTRMMGDRVFIVTYREVDPFYVIDTSKPTSPVVLGYLKIPGYSNYMHPYDENTIIGVGVNTIENASGNIVNDGVKISLFDIGDPQNPIEKDKVIIGDGSAFSEVGYDHKAFLFDAEKNILALPISMSTPFGYSKDAYIFKFDAAGKLQRRGVISHAVMSAYDKHYEDDGKRIQRILYIDDDLYTLSDKYLFLNDFDSLQKINFVAR